MTLLVLSAFAWESNCFVGEQADPLYPSHPDVCDDGYAKAQNRWIREDQVYSEVRKPEHAIIFEYALGLSGLPGDVNDDFDLETVIVPTPLAGSIQYQSVQPVLAEPKERHTRTLRVSEMTQLPDMSYTLYDWARGNETCPVSDQLSIQDCHRFDKHMGGLNSSHFLPQAEGFYRWYHDRAKERAAECKALHDEAKGTYATNPEVKAYTLQCEKSALVLEAIGQHYLQDSWSSGHMWERWGSPDLQPWADAAKWDLPEALGRQMLVALFAGSIHGSKAVLDAPDSPFQDGMVGGVTPDRWDDPMCAPAPAGDVVEYIDPYDGGPGFRPDAVGDIFWNHTHQILYSQQQNGLLSCSVNGMREVYEATGQAHGPLQDPAANINTKRVPTDTTACFGQRVTNRSLELGAGIHAGSFKDGSQTRVVKSGLAAVLHSLALYKYKGEGDIAFPLAVQTQFELEGVKILTWIGVSAALKPNNSPGKLPSLLGLEPNGTYRVPPGDKPSGWVDPKLPWSMDDDNQKALNLVFAEATAWSRCDAHDQDELEKLRLASWPVVPTEEDHAALALCKQMVDPYLRIGAPEHWDEERAPVCHFAGKGPAIWSGHGDFESVSRDSAVSSWCRREVLQDGGFEQRSGWSLEANADVHSGINTLIPYSGSSMLDVYLDPAAVPAYGKAWQALDEPLPEGEYELSFRWRMWTSWTICQDWGPWHYVRVDDGGWAVDEVLAYELPYTDWCELEEHAGGWFKTPWTETTVTFSGPVDEPVIGFIGGTGAGKDLHHWLIDDVQLRRVE